MKPFVRLQLDFLQHPKTLSLSPLAQLLFLRSIIYSSINLTDGHISPGAADLLIYDFKVGNLYPDIDLSHRCFEDMPDIDTHGLIDELEETGLWEVLQEPRIGWLIHDYLEYQLSRKEVETGQKKRAQASRNNGKYGGRPKQPSKNLAITYKEPSANLEESQNNLTNTNTNTNTNTKREGDAPPTHQSLTIQEKKPNGKARGLTEWPDGYTYNPKHEAMAQALGVHVKNEFVKFQDNALKKGLKWKDWDAAFRTWLRNAPKFNEGRMA